MPKETHIRKRSATLGKEALNSMTRSYVNHATNAKMGDASAPRPITGRVASNAQNIPPGNAHGIINHANAETGDAVKLTLPKYALKRQNLPSPKLRDIDLQKITAIDPNLEGKPIDFMRLFLILNHMETHCVVFSDADVDADSSDFVSSDAAFSDADSSDALSSIRVFKRWDANNCLKAGVTLSRDLIAKCPTHILHTVTKDFSKNAQKIQGALYLVHGLILALYCGNIPALSPSPQNERADVNIGQLPENIDPSIYSELPVVRIVVPHLESFPALLHFIYQRDGMALAKAAMQRDPPPELYRSHEQGTKFAKQIAMSSTKADIEKYIHFVYGLWQNAKKLSVNDKSLWGWIHALWMVALTALEEYEDMT